MPTTLAIPIEHAVRPTDWPGAAKRVAEILSRPCFSVLSRASYRRKDRWAAYKASSPELIEAYLVDPENHDLGLDSGRSGEIVASAVITTGVIQRTWTPGPALLLSYVLVPDDLSSRSGLVRIKLAASASKGQPLQHAKAGDGVVERVDPETGETRLVNKESGETVSPPVPAAAIENAKERFRAMHAELTDLLRAGKGEMARYRAQIKRGDQRGVPDLDAMRQCGQHMRAYQARADAVAKEAESFQQAMLKADGDSGPFGLLLAAARANMWACVSCTTSTYQPDAARHCRWAAEALRDAKTEMR